MKIRLRDTFYFIFGIILLTLGIRIIGFGDIGYAFSDAVYIKLSQDFNISIAVISSLFGVVLVLIESLLRRSRPKILSIVTSFFIGLFIDFWFLVVAEVSFSNVFLRVLIFLLGVVVLSTGVAIYIQPKFSFHPNDLIMMTIYEKFNISIFKSKLIIDSIFAITAIIVVADIGIGSFINTFCIGYCVNRIYPIVRKIYIKKIE